MDRPRSAATLRALRLRAQHLTAAAAGDAPSAGAPCAPATRQVPALVRHLTAVQAQEAPAAALALRVRAPDLTAAAVSAALTEQRSVVRTWCLRGTLQLVAAEDVSWLLSLVGAAAVRRSARRYTQLGLSEQRYREAAAVVSAAVEEQPRTRAQLTTPSPAADWP